MWRLPNCFLPTSDPPKVLTRALRKREKERERKRERKKELSANYERTNSAKELFGEKGQITNVKERMEREERKRKKV